MTTLIEKSFSSINQKHVIRTKGIELTGQGIKQHHSESTKGLYNVYTLTKKAFEKVNTQFSDTIKSFF